MEKREIKHGLHETIPPLKQAEESKIKGRDLRFSEDLMAGNKVTENAEAKKVMEAAFKKIEGIKEEINGINNLMDRNTIANEQVVSKFHSLQMQMDEIDRELFELGIGPDVEKVKKYEQMVNSLKSHFEDLERTKQELRGQIKNLEELN